MKPIFSALILLLSTGILRAQTTISSLQTGRWNEASTWDMGRAPRDGDVIVIQPAHTVNLDEAVKLSNVVLRFNGHLQLGIRANLTLNGASIINVMNGGTIQAESANADAWISLGGAMKYRSSKTFNPTWGTGKIYGLAYATGTSGNIDQGGQGFIFGTLPGVWQDLQLFRTPENFVQMVWVTSHETTPRIFHIERSTDANRWESIGSIRSTGSSSSQIIYSFMDVQPGTGIKYYRVAQEDADGQMVLSPVRSLKLGPLNGSALQVQPNPTRGAFRIPLTEALRTPIDFDICDTQGRIWFKGVQPEGSSQVEGDLSNAAPGVYLVRLHYPNGEERNSRVVKY